MLLKTKCLNFIYLHVHTSNIEQHSKRSNRSHGSPIHSVTKTPKSKSSRTQIVSRVSVNDPDMAMNGNHHNSKNGIRSTPRSVSKALFSPKYESNTLDIIDSDQDTPISPKKKPQLIDEQCRICVQEVKAAVWSTKDDEMDGFLFMKYAPPISENYFKRTGPYLPKKTSKCPEYTLVLDLDETLVHCTIEESSNPDLIFPVSFNGDQYQVYMRKRPYFLEFLQTVAQLFEVVVFTASQKCYAETLLNKVDAQKKLISHRLFRDHCVQVEGNFVKDLRVLGRDLSKTIIIDNSPPAFTYQPENGIPIVSWFEDSNDTELLKMIPILKKLKNQSDVRPHIKKFFELHKLVEQVAMTNRAFMH